MTYNQVITRLRLIALAHKQVRSFQRGLVTDFLSVKTTKYSGIFLQDSAGVVGLSTHQFTFNFRAWFLDMVHVSEDSNENEQDVISDEFSIILDYFAELNRYTDWKISGTNNAQIQVEYDNDMLAGWYVDFSVSSIYDQNVCEVPTNDINLPPPTETDMNVYDLIYPATGDEGTTLDTSDPDSPLHVLNGKKILLVTREYSPLYRVSNLPNTTEYTWNNAAIVLGLSVYGPGERFLFLYRNY
jgi:hypothetical protein